MSTERQINYLAEQLTKMEEQMIDPRDFGRLEGEVHSLRQQVADLASKVEQLLELANKSRGAMWFGIGVVGFASSLATTFISKLIK